MCQPLLVSACLLGLLTRYDGKTKRNQKVIDFIQKKNYIPIPVCPEQLSGLATPRKATCFASGSGPEILDGAGTMVNAEGQIMNEIFLKGAIETMKIARLTGCSEALLKERSPSCGVHKVYLGEEIVSGQGVACALLKRNGLKIFSEEDL